MSTDSNPLPGGDRAADPIERLLERRLSRRRLLGAGLAGAVLAGCAGGRAGVAGAAASAEATSSEAAQLAVSLGVDAADVLEPSTVQDFVAFQGGPLWMFGSDRWEDPAFEKLVLPAWRALRPLPPALFLFQGAPSTSPFPGAISVTRGPGGGGPGGDLSLYFGALDAQVDFYRRTLAAEGAAGRQWQLFVGTIPQALSSMPRDDPDFDVAAEYCNPADPREWMFVVSEAVRHVREELGIVGARYWLAWENETYSQWRGRNRPDWHRIEDREEKRRVQQLLLEDLLDLVRDSYFAVLAGDPDASTGAPSTASYTERDYPDGLWGLETFLRRLAERNAKARATGGDPVLLHELVWQGYDGYADRYLETGARSIAEQLALYPQDYDPAMPQTLGGWNSEWICGPSGDPHPQPLHWKASHLASSAIRELTRHHHEGPSPRVRYAQWYDFDSNPAGKLGWEAGDCDRHLSAITAPFPVPPELDPSQPRDDPPCLRPLYAAFQALAAMTEGAFVRASPPTRAPSGAVVECMAVRDGERLLVLLSNNTELGATARLTVENLPAGWTQARRTLQRIDRRNSNDCRGLEPGLTTVLAVGAGSVSVTVPLSGRSVRLLTLSQA